MRPARMMPVHWSGWLWLAWVGAGVRASSMTVTPDSAHRAATDLDLRIVAADGREVRA